MAEDPHAFISKRKPSLIYRIKGESDAERNKREHKEMVSRGVRAIIC